MGGYACTKLVLNADLKDFSEEIDAQIYKAKGIEKRVKVLEEKYRDLYNGNPEADFRSVDLSDGLSELENAVKYYRLYFYSENASEEGYREGVLRKHAKKSSCAISSDVSRSMKNSRFFSLILDFC